jgi:hypothetical protein
MTGAGVRRGELAAQRRSEPEAEACCGESAEPTSPSSKLSAAYAGGPVVRLPVQPRLIVGRAGDRYEQEADRVADRVTAGQAAPEVSRIPPGGLAAQREPVAEEKSEEHGGDAAQAKCSGCGSEPMGAQMLAGSGASDPCRDLAQKKCAPCAASEPAEDSTVQTRCAPCEESEQQEAEGPTAQTLVQRQADDDDGATPDPPEEATPTEDTEDTEEPAHPDEEEAHLPDCDAGAAAGAG